nr:GtrA family protein [uncultured Rhodopila sp.]
MVTGGIAAGVNIVSRWLLEYFVSYEVSIGIAYLIGMTTAFFLARIFVFEPVAGDAHWQFVRFTLVNAIAFAQVWLVSVGLARLVFPAIGYAWQPELVAHVIGVMSPIVSSYVLHKRFSFRSPSGRAAGKVVVRN